MRRKGTIKSLSSDSSEDDEPLSNLRNGKQKKPSNAEEDSSSESDIENYLQRPDKLDLDSEFFNLPKAVPSFESDKKTNVSRLIDSEPENEEKENEDELKEAECEPSTSKLNFSQLHEYMKKLEETKKHVEEYNKRRQAQEKDMNVENLLAAGESQLKEELKQFTGSLHSSDFESCSDSEKEGWEEVKEEDKNKSKIDVPKEGLQITVEMPGAVKKKKGVDLLLAIKRRINRVRKENQVLIHKVHLLCWIAHGNYVNSKINSQNVLGTALSLLPSEKCYPPNRTDLKYLEQILKWYRNTLQLVEKPTSNDKSLDELLESQISNKQAFNKKMFVYIFIAIMRSLGIQCRLVLSFQVEPLRPPISELHSLSTKTDDKNAEKKEDGEKKCRSKSTDGDKVKTQNNKSRSKSTSDISNSKAKASTSKKPDDSKLNTANSKNKINSKPLTSSKDDGFKQKTAKTEDTKSSKSKSVPHKTNNSDQGNVLKPKKMKAPDSKKEISKSEEKNDSTRSTKTKSARSKSMGDNLTKLDDIKEKNKSRFSTRIRSLSAKNEEVSSRSKSPKVQKTAQIKIKLKDKKQKNVRKTRNGKETAVPQLDGTNDTETTSKPNLKKLKQKEPPCPIKEHPKRLKTVRKYKDSSSDSESDFSSRSPFSKRNTDSPKTNAVNLKKLKSYVPKNDVRKDIVDIMKKTIKEQKDLDKLKKVKKRKSTKESEDDSDYVPEAPKKKPGESEDEFAPKMKVKRRIQVKPDSQDGNAKKPGMDIWVEVFLEAEEKWISVDVVRGQVHCVNELHKRATQPVSYIVAWNNNSSLKDITRRYCVNYNTVTRKLRIDAKWWEAATKPFLGVKNARDKEEDDELERQQLEKPLPTSIGEYKNHPLYVLKRHLLKFEALYPPDPPILGFVRNEPVYSRQCVYVLHSRDIWLKHAKVVKLGEQPYKIVKARPKWDRLSNKMITDQLLEIFGPWQVEDYVPPTAENGIVPRNAFGNVELFKPCMLPKGTVHLKLPGLNKVAKRMNIDCAAALTGFDFHGGWNHPTYDGFIVCEEFADELVAAWEIEQDEIEKREQEKIDKRVYGNWKRLIKGLLIRERLKAKFGENFGGGEVKKKEKLSKSATKKRPIESDESD